MGLAIARKDQKVSLVCSEDPDVEPKGEAVGWMLRHEAHLSEGADVVVVRPLGTVELASTFDGRGPNHKLALMAQSGVVSVNGEDGGQWLQACPYMAAVTLGAYVQDISLGQDPKPRQRALFGASDIEPDDDIGDD